MKISIYALHLGFGGVEKYVATIANILSSEHEVEIISTYRTTQEPAFEINKSVKITYLLPHLLPNTEAFHTARKQKKFFKVLREGVYAVYVLYKRRQLNIKAIKQDKSDVLISTRIFHNRLISKYASRQSVKITGEHNHPHGNETYIKKVVASCANFNYFIPISKALCELYTPRFENAIEVKNIPFCIEDSGVEFYRIPERMNLINVGRLSSEKGIPDLIHVIDRLVHKENCAVTLQLIGSGDEETQIKKLIKDLHLEDYITMHGFQSKEYIYGLYKQASLYVMTSYTESFGIVLLEAMSCGVPCIAYDSAEGSREIITNGVDGFLIKNRDIEAMCQTIKDTLSQQGVLKELSTHAFEKAASYSYTRCKTAWLDLFRHIANSR